MTDHPALPAPEPAWWTGEQVRASAVNRMKGTLELSEFVRWCRLVAKRFGSLESEN